MEPSVSVIIPVRNREKLVIRCLESIMHQISLPDEIIVVDNDSTDSTYEVVKTWMIKQGSGKIDFKLLNEKRIGACRARQKGLEASRGDFLIFFDSDDEMVPDLIESVRKEIKKSPIPDIVVWPCCINLLNGISKVPPFMINTPLESHLIHALLRPQGYAVRKDFLESAGGWKKPVEVWNDFELGLRLLLNNPKIIGIKKILAEIHSQEDSITGKDFSSKEGKWERTLTEMEKTNEIRNHVEKNKIKRILDYRRAILAAHYFREGNKKGASSLIKETLEGKSLKESVLLIFAYYYTKAGMRGAWRIIGPFIK